MDLANQERDASFSKLAVAIFLASYMVASWISLEFYNPPLNEPFDNPPWYFIRRDAVRGLCFLPLFLACVATILLAVRKNFTQTARNLTGVGFFAFQPVWQLLLISLRTEDLFDRANASTSWTTFDSYLYDPWGWGWLVLALALFLVLKIREFRRRPTTASP